MRQNIFVTGIDTGVGKTVVSAIICKALSIDYWKPIQSGSLDASDTLQVKRLVGAYAGRMHPEAYALKHALSPHAAAALEQTSIQLSEIHLPPSDNNLLIEGAGGVMVPLNKQHLMIDLIKQLEASVIVVSKNYLGSINHTLLTLSSLKQANIPVLGILYVGAENIASEAAVSNFSGVKIIGHVDWNYEITPEFIDKQAEKLRPVLISLFEQEN